MLKRSRPFALIAILAAGVLVAALTGAARPLPAGQFALSGHWVFNSLLQMALHIDGATTNIDAHANVNGAPGSQVVQSDTHGYVVGTGTITQFDKATLEVRGSISPPAEERPEAIEGVGGPYLAYRNSGMVMRMGDPPTVIKTGGAFGTPILTKDGTLWLHRREVGQICTVNKNSPVVDGCPVSVPPGHDGALTIVDDRPEFVDTFTSTLHTIDNGKLGDGVPLGVSVPPTARPATQDVGGRVAILDPQRQTLLLADTKSPPAPPITVALPPGDYDGPMSTGDVVVLVDRQSGNVLTFAPDGRAKDTKPIKQKTGQPRLSQGEDNRVYVEDADGTQVIVVAKDGNVQDVSTAERPTQTQPPVPAPNTGGPPDGRVAAPPPSSSQPPRQPTGQPDKPQQPVAPPPAVPPGRPGAPPSVSGTAGNNSVAVKWGAAANNRAEITSYQVSWRASTGQTGSLTLGGGARQTTVNGLTNGVSYVFTVTAINQMGAGPGSASAAITPVAPVSPAGPPLNLQASYDKDDRPTRDVTLSWGQPQLNGGTLVHYLVTGTGQAQRTVTGTQTTYPQLQASTRYTFTVRAVTKTPGGNTVNGQAQTVVVQDSQPPAVNPKITISKGGRSSTSNCKPPNCFWVPTTLTGFAPNKRYRLTLSSSSNPTVNNDEFATTDAQGKVTYPELNYDVPGQEIWVWVQGPNGRVESNHIVW
ncbi:hypothetical protein ALI144C_22275 [Actinosynnema sp. ALI-1.44]|uniref:fibronectin type III domain-containing protein n=1 Tax=Actinosynnema sp. ALI-1.44 TaxID=1933779 RepID=UPI00097BFF04|nr:fibronectin type III domain-containing protein [Actinosynnema sp. ALI-1.44]ONI81256.1 hypothetical protein ALI144C_22275 [Actinosynnema sp. ALI-1.44]